jgi:hypothetical protein
MITVDANSIKNARLCDLYRSIEKLENLESLDDVDDCGNRIYRLLDECYELDAITSEEKEAYENQVEEIVEQVYKKDLKNVDMEKVINLLKEVRDLQAQRERH